MYSVPVKNYYGEEQRMDESREIEYLMHFGLSRQEALIYRKLLEGGKKTGYEIARDTGISRSNAYASLAAMVEKGAAYLVEGDGDLKKSWNGFSRIFPASPWKRMDILRLKVRRILQTKFIIY